MSHKLQDDELVMKLVEMALATPPDERLKCLRNVCGEDTELLTEVLSCVEWERQMEGFLAKPLLTLSEAEHPFEPGQVLAGRFRVVQELAQGGMGIVYEAYDEKLRRRIALKCAKTGYGQQLPPEVRNASDISHSNICKIFEIHTAQTSRGPVEFFTMEFLEGETLAQRLRRGPLSRSELREIARQICTGVAEAHRKQIIHGDLKTGNVILTKDESGNLRVVITDFGLARQGEGAIARMPSGAAGGTPDYMAPELWKGAKASVATDVYALGVILREMAPADGRPRNWDRIAARCVAEDPAKRFPNAEAIANLIVPRKRRWLLAAALAAILAIASAFGTYWRVTAPEKVRLAVLEFDGEAELETLAQQVNAETIRVLRRIRAGPDTALTFSPTPAGATHVLRVVLSRDNGRVLVQAWITDARSLSPVKDWAARYDASELKYVPVALGGVTTEAFHLKGLTESATVNSVALPEYTAGLRQLRRNSTIDQAIPLFEQAVAKDPHSPLTHAGLAEVRWWKYFLSGDSTWRDLSEFSAKEAERRNPDLPEVHRIAGLLHATRGWYQQARSRYLRAIELDPRDGDSHRRLAMAYENENEDARALAEFRKAIEVDPGHYRNHQALGHFFYARGNYTEAVRHFSHAVQAAPDESTPHSALATAHNALGQYEEAEKQLRQALAIAETADALNSLGAVLMCQGRDKEAVPYFVRALSRGPEQYLWWMNLGTAYRRLGRGADAANANRRALMLADGEMKKNPRNGYVRACLAYLCAWLGNRRRAESEIAQALQLTPVEEGTRRMAVKAYEALGRRDDSLAVLRASSPAVVAEVGRYPDLAALSRDPRFKKLLGAGLAK